MIAIDLLLILALILACAAYTLASWPKQHLPPSRFEHLRRITSRKDVTNIDFESNDDDTQAVIYAGHSCRGTH